MNGETAQPINILLSRDELLFVLHSLRANFVLGLDIDPLGDRDSEQQTLALAVAGRALRARGLAQSLEKGQTAIHNALLAAVGVCAYPQQTVSVYHWPARQEFTTRYFGHMRGNEVVAHTRPEDVLHLLSRLPSRQYLVDQVITVCKFSDVEREQAIEFTISSQAFAQARQLAEQGQTDEAVALLESSNAPTESAQAFVATLAHAPSVTIVQSLKRQNSAVDKQECTIVQNSQNPWLIRATGEGNAPLSVKSSSKAEIQEVLAGWVK